MKDIKADYVNPQYLCFQSIIFGILIGCIAVFLVLLFRFTLGGFRGFCLGHFTGNFVNIGGKAVNASHVDLGAAFDA